MSLIVNSKVQKVVSSAWFTGHIDLLWDKFGFRLNLELFFSIDSFTVSLVYSSHQRLDVILRAAVLIRRATLLLVLEVESGNLHLFHLN